MSKEKSYESVNKADDWRDFTENPPQNGWYDIWRKQKMYVKDKTGGGVSVSALLRTCFISVCSVTVNGLKHRMTNIVGNCP